MLESVLEKVESQIADKSHRAARTTAAVTEAFEDGVGMAKRAMKHGCDAVEEVMDDTQQRIKRHPVESLVASFAAGTLTGILVGWLARRK